MLQNLVYQQPPLPHHQSLGNLSEGNISDTISESSDNATLLSLSREDLAALGAGPIREDVRVNRKKLESLILRERDNHSEKHYMDSLMERTNTYIQWPSRMKIGAKTKKDLFIRVYGHNQDDVNEAKNQILADLGPHRDLRITLKLEISYTDHSHLIGCRGQTIRRVMEDTGCHIHFPDSNRMSKEHKSNQVTIAGSAILSVEQARARVRELSPLIFQFSLPMIHSQYDLHQNPDAHHVFIENIQANYHVQVTVHPPNKLQQTTVSVKGCEVDAAAVKEAVAKIVSYFSGGNMNSFTVESTMEVSSVQHTFVRAVNDSNVHAIMMNTGAKIIFPDLSDNNIQQIKRSRVYISGDIHSVYNARQQLIGCLPLRMIFDLADDFQLDWESARQTGADLNVNVKLINRNRTTNDRQGSGSLSSLPPPIPGRSRTIQLIAAERNTSNIFEARRRILGGAESPITAFVPHSYHLRPTYTSNVGAFPFANRLGSMTGPLPPLLLPTSPNMLSPVLSPSFWPPTPFSSPFCSPPIATCVLNTSNSNGNNMNHGGNNAPPGMSKLTLNLQHGLSYGYNGLSSPSPINQQPPPEININNMSMNGMKHHMHLPLIDTHNQHARDSTLNTPMSIGGTSTLSELSPMTPMHPGVGMVNALINDFGSMDLKRKAPGCERSNTVPNLLTSMGSNGELSASRSQSPAMSTSTNPEDLNGSATLSRNDIVADKINNPTSEKKYMAVKAMYHSKIGPNPRVPTSEWSGCGFSKTYSNLFSNGVQPVIKKDGTGNEDGQSSSSSSTNWTSEASGGSNSSSDQPNNDRNSNKDGSTTIKTHNPLGHQNSNLLDFAATRPNPDRPPTDLASLFIQNGLERYIDTFVSEEIDLDAFSTLTEGDLRSLGVTAYPARKRMLVLITQLACPHPNQDWH